MGTLLVLLITLLAIANGFLLVSFVDKCVDLWLRLCAGAVIGLALLTWIGFLISLVGGLDITTISIASCLLIALLIVLLRTISREKITVRWNPAAMLYYLAWAGLMAWLFGRVVIFEESAFKTAPANNYGDLPFHLSAISSFAYGENVPPHNPIFAGLRFTYPFLIDFLTAFYLRAGAGWRVAFFIENFILAMALVGLIERLTRQLTGDRLASRIAPVIFFFHGGFGFINFFRDLAQTDDFIKLLTHLPRAYTMNAELALPFGQIPLRWGNVFTTLLIPQRSLLFGLPFVALILICWWKAICAEADSREQRRLFFAAGTIAGMLPLLHAHSFFAIMIASPILVVLFWSREWLAFFGPISLFATPQMLYLRSTPVRNQLFQWHWGWEAGENSPLIFWLTNAGIFLLLLAIAFCVRGLIKPRVCRFAFAFMIWFIVPNLVLLAPWPWDNIKVLTCWSLASSPLVATVLAIGLQRKLMWRFSSLVLLIILSLSGALDVARALSPIEKIAVFGPKELEIAELIRQQTPPHAMILHAPIHNSVLCLTGRQSVMGYPGHLWTHGIDYRARERDVRAIYQQGSKDLLAKYNIDYVLVGPIERAQLQANEGAFATTYPIVIEHASYRLYQIKP